MPAAGAATSSGQMSCPTQPQARSSSSRRRCNSGSGGPHPSSRWQVPHTLTRAGCPDTQSSSTTSRHSSSPYVATEVPTTALGPCSNIRGAHKGAARAGGLSSPSSSTHSSSSIHNLSSTRSLSSSTHSLSSSHGSRRVSQAGSRAHSSSSSSLGTLPHLNSHTGSSSWAVRDGGSSRALVLSATAQCSSSSHHPGPSAPSSLAAGQGLWGSPHSSNTRPRAMHQLLLLLLVAAPPLG